MAVGRNPGGSLGKWASQLGASTAGTTGHVFGGGLHTADTLANLNALVSDDTLAAVGTANTFTAQQTFTTGINLTAGQLIFPATQIASADANTLDDYEEGDWTPVLMDASNDGTGEGQIYTIQTGRYLKLGNQIRLSFDLQTSTIGSLTGSDNIRIGGFPFITSTASNFSGHVYFGSGLAIGTGESITFSAAIGSAQGTPQKWGSTAGGTNNVLVSEWTSDGRLIGGVIYEI